MNASFCLRSCQIMAGVVAMASVIEDFDTQVKKQRNFFPHKHLVIYQLMFCKSQQEDYIMHSYASVVDFFYNYFCFLSK